MTRHRHRVLAFLVMLFAITYIDRVLISAAGPRMQEDFDIDPVMWGWVTAMFTLSYCLFEIPTGSMGDHAGAIIGFMNTSAQVGGFLSSVAYGYIVTSFESYDAPFVPMAGLLFVGTLLWLRIDASTELTLAPPDTRLQPAAVAIAAGQD